MTQEQTNNKTEERMNRFNGESVMLTKDESIIHDRIFLNELAATSRGQSSRRGDGYVKALGQST